MRKSEIKMILIITLIGLIIVGGIIIWSKTKNGPSEQEEAQNETYVEVLEDGTKLNTSEKLHETKIIDGIELSNLQLTEKNNVSLILGTVRNVSNTTKGGYPIKVKIIDNEGQEIITIEAYLTQLEPGETAQFNTSASFDYSNAYDFIISKK